MNRRLIVFFVIALVFILGLFLIFAPNAPSKKYYTNIRRPLVIAHQGGDGIHPGDTMSAFENAVNIGSDVLEMDAHITKDGKIVLMHDESVDLTLALAPRLHRAGSADQIPQAGERVRAEAAANVDRGQSRQRDAARIEEDEVGVAVAVGIDRLDEDDSTARFGAPRPRLGRTPGLSDHFGGLRAMTSVVERRVVPGGLR